ncbi:MAG: redoxin domain-containing protein, partial [Myxococcota bacterium]
PAPDFSLKDLDGETFVLSQHRGSLVVLEWFNPDCPFTRFSHSEGPLFDLPEKTVAKHPGVVWVAVNSSAPGREGHGLERNRAAHRQYGLQIPILQDESGRVGRAYGAKATPQFFVIDGRGVLRYRGAPDNAPMGERSSEPYAAYLIRAIDAIAVGQAPKPAETRAYGCSVKY